MPVLSTAEVCYLFRRALAFQSVNITKNFLAVTRFIWYHQLRADSPTRKSGVQKQAATWLTPEQIEQVRDACLTDAFPNYLQGRNETIIVLLADTGLRVSELVALDWDHVDLNADPAELYLPGRIQKGMKRDAYVPRPDHRVELLQASARQRYEQTAGRHEGRDPNALWQAYEADTGTEA